MLVLHAFHLIALIMWFGSALADVIVELTIAQSKDPATRTALMELHRRVDLILEGPGALLAVLSGLGLGWQTGLFAAPLPAWLVWKLVCGGAAVAINFASVACVVTRVRTLRAGDEAAVARWSRAVLATGAGVPFAAVAFWLGVSHFGT